MAATAGETDNVDSNGAVDWDQALKHVGGRATLLRQLAALLALECDRRLPEIDAAIQAGDATQLRCLAHALRNSAETLAAQGAVQAARRLELMGKQGNLTGAGEACSSLAMEIGRLKHALIAHVNG